MYQLLHFPGLRSIYMISGIKPENLCRRHETAAQLRQLSIQGVSPHKQQGWERPISLPVSWLSLDACGGK